MHNAVAGAPVPFCVCHSPTFYVGAWTGLYIYVYVYVYVYVYSFDLVGIPMVE